MWHHMIMVKRAIAQAALYLSFVSSASASETIPAPEGLKPCSPGDPVLSVEARVATRLGGDLLGCFRSDPIVAAEPAPRVSTPTEYAFAIAVHDRDYTVADLQQLLSKVKQQWRDFEPLQGSLSDEYLLKLYDLIREQRDADNTSVKSVRPVLVKIDGEHSGYYIVTSIRTYVVEADGMSVKATKVNADAVVIRNSGLVRLTIQRTLTDPADVARAQADIDRWARSIA